MNYSASRMFKKLRNPSLDHGKFRGLCEKKGVTIDIAHDLFAYIPKKREILRDSGRTVLYAEGGRVVYVSDASEGRIGNVFRKDYDSVYGRVEDEIEQSSSAPRDVGKLVSQEEAQRLFKELKEAVK